MAKIWNYCNSASVKWQNHFGKLSVSLKKLNINLSYDPEIPLLDCIRYLFHKLPQLNDLTNNKHLSSHIVSEGQEFRSGLVGWFASGSLMRFQLIQPGPQSPEGWMELEALFRMWHTHMTDKLRMVAGQRLQFLTTWIPPYCCLSVLLAAGVLPE